jgi:flagellar hook-associated protein 2
MATTAVSSTSNTSTNAAGTSTAAQVAAANKASAQKIISSLSAGSGVDVASLAQNLVEAERAPQANAINAKITKNDNKVSGLSAVMFMMSELKNTLSAVKDKDSFNSVSASTSNTSAVNVTASTSATVGSHDVVVNALSSAQRSLSAGFASSSTPLNVGSDFALTLTGTNTEGFSAGTPSTSSTYQATISSPMFGTSPSVSDFKNFGVTVDGKTYNLTPAPATATLTDLAANIQSQLRILDGSSDLRVTVSGGTGLMIESASATRVVTNPSLSNATVINLDNGALAGTANADTITDASFGTSPSTGDFSAFSVNIGGTVRTLAPGPITPTMAALASNLQSQLRTLDGSTDITVTYSGTDLKVVSASGRAVTGITLAKKTYADTPAGLVSAINASNRGFKAQLINDGGSASPYKVIITGATGATEGFSMASTSATDLGFTTAAGYVASDAQVTVDGISYKRKTNTITDIVTGLTLDLKATSATAASVVVTRDVADIKNKLKALVVAYNDFNDIANQTTNPKSTLETYGATLVGDSTVRMVRQQIRTMIFSQSSTPGASIKSLGDMGYSLNEKGVLSLDEAKLDKVLASNFDDVTKVLTGGYNKLSTYSTAPAGIAGDAFKKLTNLLASSGPLMTKSENANTENTRYQSQLAKLQLRMDALLARYQKQFASMDSLVGSVNSQKTSLKSTFDGMMAAYTNK